MFQAQATHGKQSKADFYRDLERQLRSLLADEHDAIANLANFSSLVFTLLPDLNWAGFYLLKGNDLLLGPFQGKPACVRIPVLPTPRGVCGTAAYRRETQVVANVHEFPGHIACDSASNSEIVIPLVSNNTLIGVLDVDSPLLSRFDAIDRAGLEAMVATLLELTGFSTLRG